jgi:preprotein translocase subunit SecF
MELFKDTNYDFLGKKWPFIIASLVLTVAGFISIGAKGGLKYGIDFKQGVMMTVKFAYSPPLDKIRGAMSGSPKIKGEVSVQNETSAQNTVEIGTEAPTEGQMNVNRQDMADVLTATFGQPSSGKLDFNNAGHDALAERLRDALARNNVAASEQDLQNLAASLLSARDSEHSGLIGDECSFAPYNIVAVESIGPKIGAELRNKAVLATLYALGGMLVYIAFRFEWIYGLAAVVATFHDVLITLGLFSLFNKEISLNVVAALLTLVGYSMNDTIVVFDRIRETVKQGRRGSFEAIVNESVNRTLSRTVLTSGLTFISAIALLLFGGQVLHGFSFALVCGIIVGTYSSIFVASPIVLFWHGWVDRRGGNRTAPAAVKAVK